MPSSTVTFRANKGQALTYSEMDKNFGSFFYSSSLSGNGQNLLLHYTGSSEVPINSGSHTINLIRGLTNAGSDRRIAFFSGSSTIETSQGFVVDTSGSVGIKVNESGLPLSYALDVSGSIRASGTVVQSSDERLKENIHIIDNASSKLDSIDGVYFNWKQKEEKRVGVLAQQVQKVLPEVVSEDNKGYLNVDYGGLVPLLIETVKEQNSKIEDLNNRITLLENKNS
tara:strand:- start:180 stop:857 length:678 start_codon:yes stop_codon:yes gene_type:complete